MITQLDSSILADFIAESTEHLASVEDDFMLLEKDPEAVHGETIHRIFRAVHTVKGSAGFLGLIAIGSVAHAMETLLAMVREGERTLNPAMFDALLAGIDMLKSLIENIETSNSVDVTAVEQAVLFFVNGDTVEKPKEIALYSESEHTAHFTLSKSVAAQFEPASFLYEIKIDLTEIEQLENGSLIAFIAELQKTGDIVDGMVEPDDHSFDDEELPLTVLYRFLYCTVLEPEFMSVLFPVTPRSIIQLRKEDLSEPQEIQKTVAVSEESIVHPIIVESPTILNEPVAHHPDHTAESLRVRVDILDKLMMLAGELVLVRNQQLMHTTGTGSDPVFRNMAQRLDVVTSELQEMIMRTRMQPVGTVFSKFSRIVRDIGKQLGKEIELTITGNEVELDKNIIEGLGDPLTHIIRNSCDHGLETPAERITAGKPEAGKITLDAYHEGGHIHIHIADDGRGISRKVIAKKVVEKGLCTEEEVAVMTDKEIVSLIFLPGFSTADQVTSISGRGVGMDVVKNSIERLGGVIELNSEEGKGTSMILRLPLTLAIIPSLIVKSQNQLFAIPQINLEELVCLYDHHIHEKIQCAGSREVYHLRDTLLPIVHLDEILASAIPWNDDHKSALADRHRVEREAQYAEFKKAVDADLSAGISTTFAVVKAGNIRYGLVIDSVLGTEEIVVKPMPRVLKRLSIYSGATVLGDGQVSLILDTQGIARHADLDLDQEERAEEKTVIEQTGNAGDLRELLLFKSGPDEQFALDLHDVQRIEKITMSSLERVGHKEFITLKDRTVPIVRLESAVDVSACVHNEEMYLIMPNRGYGGILASEVIDIGSYPVTIDTKTVQGKAIEGSAVIRNHLSQILNITGLFETIGS